ncbi:hypothetical protein [Bacillus toyonensis]|uniref:hypothetical protein n=1 Tax=Bacillus toyonensis TaxID=155322 RepID=UPI000BF1C2C7|nr:hypothetical protein [Bacillus toyonensis]PEN62336.1 hypothetical protein CN545_29960 [Bacillus toyonensis]
MFEHNELNPNESEARSHCCPINYDEDLSEEDLRFELEKDITVQRNATLRKWFRIPNLHRGSIQVYLEPEDNPYIKILDLTLYEINLIRETDRNVPPHLRNAYYVDREKVEDFESGEVIEIPRDCGCGYEVQGTIEIFVPDSVDSHTLNVKMVCDLGAGSNWEVPFQLVII